MTTLPLRSALFFVALASVAVAAVLFGVEQAGRHLLPRQAPEPSRAPAGPAPDYRPLERDVRRFLAGSPAAYGVYCKDLSSGAEWGIDADRPFPAASTFNLPLVLHLYELAARGRVSLDESVVYDPDTDYRTGARILRLEAVPGRSYSLRVLANLNITVSDNVAAALLLRRLGRDKLAAFMRDLGGRVVFPDGRNVSTARDMGRYGEETLSFSRRHRLGETLWKAVT